MLNDRIGNLLFAVLAGCVLSGAASGPAAAGGSEDSALVGAARDDLASSADALLRRHADVNARDETGATALAWAVFHGNAKLAQQLLDAGAQPNLTDVNGVGPLALAADSDAQDLVEMLVAKGANPNLARANGETPLMTAVRVGSLELVKQFIARGADVQAREKRFGQTALMWAAGHPQIVRQLLDAGADPNAVTNSWDVTATIYTPTTATLGVTGIPWNNDGEYTAKAGGLNALLFAVQKRDLESARMLLDAGVDVNAAAADGSTALLRALYKWEARPGKGLRFAADLRMANFLLDRGARVNVADAAGYTPLHGTVLSLVLNTPEGATALSFNPGKTSEANPVPPKPPGNEAEVLALAQRLLDAGADPNRQTRYPTPGPVNAVRISPAPPGSAPFHIAAAAHSRRLVSLMAERGANPNLVRKDGHTPFSVSVMADDLPVVKEMVARGADLKLRYDPADQIADPVESRTQARKGQAILHIAAVPGSSLVVDYLVSAGASLYAKNDRGETPLDLADAQERFRYARDREGRQGLGPKGKLERETQTSTALKKLMGSRSEVAAVRAPSTP